MPGSQGDPGRRIGSFAEFVSRARSIRDNRGMKRFSTWVMERSIRSAAANDLVANLTPRILAAGRHSERNVRAITSTLWHEAEAQRRRGRKAVAVELTRLAVAMWRLRPEGNEGELARTLIQLANLLPGAGETGLPEITEALAILADHGAGHEDLHATAYTVLAGIRFRAGEYDEAVEAATRAVAGARDLPDGDRALFHALKPWAWSLLEADRDAEALPVLEEMIAVARGLGDDAGLAEALCHLGVGLLCLDRVTDARAAAAESVALWRRVVTPETEPLAARARDLLTACRQPQDS